ncbi:MAG TPA: hotdog fold domain-containing protein [Steroidobacteraceae bacterium]|nr:hotdog fold domain-containing protein [Steroidobacteraceae bacterium]
MNAVSSTPRVLHDYRRLASLPCGRWLFARIVSLRAPYFASIRPRFHELRPGFCQVSLRKRRAVLNHIGTVHAIAMANLCELACGMLMEVTIPTHMRWIPRGMTIQYLRKAETDVTGTARLDKSAWAGAEDVGVPVSVTDRHGTEVVRAVITMYVSERKQP